LPLESLAFGYIFSASALLEHYCTNNSSSLTMMLRLA
jgi:hypothetical protein